MEREQLDLFTAAEEQGVPRAPAEVRAEVAELSASLSAEADEPREVLTCIVCGEAYSVRGAAEGEACGLCDPCPAPRGRP